MVSKFNFSTILNRWNRSKTKIANSVSNKAFKYFKSNYYREGWEPVGFQKWVSKKRKNGKKILVNKGVLRGSIFIASKRFNQITIATNVPYGEYHQTGTTKMPQRPFLYNSEKLEQEILKEIDNTIKNMLNLK